MSDYVSGVWAGAVWTLVAVLVGAIIASVIMFYYLRDPKPPATVVPGNTEPVPDYPPATGMSLQDWSAGW